MTVYIICNLCTGCILYDSLFRVKYFYCKEDAQAYLNYRKLNRDIYVLQERTLIKSIFDI